MIRLLITVFVMGLLTSCSPPRSNIQLHVSFVPYYKEQDLSCELNFTHSNSEWRAQNLAFFVSSIYSNEQKDPALQFIPSDWQTKQSSLIRFDSGCETSNTAKANHSAIVSMDTKQLEQLNTLSFEIAVPFESNHKNPLTQASPLNNPEMFWSWQAGHKFLRFDTIQTDGNASWSFHLGSIGCSSASSLREPENECEMPNRIKVRVDLKEQAKQIMTQSNDYHLKLKFDLHALLNDIDIASSKSCMFELEQQQACQLLMQNLSSQKVFSAISGAPNL